MPSTPIRSRLPCPLPGKWLPQSDLLAPYRRWLHLRRPARLGQLSLHFLGYLAGLLGQLRLEDQWGQQNLAAPEAQSGLLGQWGLCLHLFHPYRRVLLAPMGQWVLDCLVYPAGQ